MRFDDMLATVLAQPADSPTARATVWRQLVDLIAQRRGIDDPALLARAQARIVALLPDMSLAIRRQTARAIAHGHPPLALVAAFAGDAPVVAAPLLALIRLDDAEWLELLPTLGPSARALLRHRQDLSPAVTTALASFGAADLILDASEEAIAAAIAALAEAAGEGEPERIDVVEVLEQIELEVEAPVTTEPGPEFVPPPVPPMPPLPPTAAPAMAAGAQIRDLVARIEAFRSARRAAAIPVAPSVAEAEAREFRFETDGDGVICWLQGVPRSALIGETIAEPGEGARGVDGYAAGACRRRAPFRDARLSVAGDGPAGGEWRISAVPFFDHEDGRFLGYRGTGRRPRPDERAGPRTPPGLFGSGLPADSLRQLVHELRTPINAVTGFAEMIERQMLGPIGEGCRTRAADIVGQAHRLLAAIDDLDLAARLDTQRLPLEPTRIDAATLIARVREGFMPLATARGVSAEVEAAPALPEIAGDPSALERMMSRLATATIGMAAPGETIRISLAAAESEGWATLSVARPAAFAGRREAQLLDPGYDPDGNWPDAPTLGLGFALRLVRNLAAASHGRLDIEEDAFRLHLPLASARALAGGGESA